jgi:phytoene synthase
MHPSSPDHRPAGVVLPDLGNGSMRTGSRSFFAASLLLPQRIRRPASALYAFCRLADDAVDQGRDPGAALLVLQERLQAIYTGRGIANAVDRNFAQVVEAYHIPRALPEALIEGFAWDAEGRRYRCFSELKDYAARVAGTVGAMMALIMGARSEEALARACDLGVAMQMTNIARDVGEDARRGRVYLPIEWLQQTGLDPDAWLTAPTFNPGIGYAVQRLLRAADLIYQRAEAGIALLSPAYRPGIRAARLFYAEIGREVARAGFDSVSRRAVVPRHVKLRLVARAFAGASVSLAPVPLGPIAAKESRFLVDAVTAARVPLPAIPQGRIEARISWLVDLYERLERQDRLARSGSSLVSRPFQDLQPAE